METVGASQDAPVPTALTEDMRRLLTAFDDQLIEALRAAIIRLVCVAWMLAQPDAFKKAILVVYAPRYREVITAMPTKAHRGAAMMRHVADIKSIHSSNDCEHHRRPIDVVMTTQPSSRRRLAEARGKW